MGTKSPVNTREVDPTATAAHQTAPPAESRGNPLAPARLQQKASSLANLRATFTFGTIPLKHTIISMPPNAPGSQNDQRVEPLLHIPASSFISFCPLIVKGLIRGIKITDLVYFH
jgi:hypothetical protein